MSEINNSSFNDLYGDIKTPISNNINELVNIYSNIDSNESKNQIANITNIQNSIYDHLSNITNIVQTTLGEIDKTSSGVTYLTIPDHIDNYKNQTKDYRSYFRQPKYLGGNITYHTYASTYNTYADSKISESTVQPVNTFGVSNLSYMFANTTMTSIVNNGKNKAVIDNDENLTMQYFDMMNKNLSYCFDGSGVQYVNSFNISGSTVYNMFRDTENLNSVYFLNANLKDSSYMFYNSGINSVGNSVFNLNNCSHMFENCTNLKTINRDELVWLKQLFGSSVEFNTNTSLGFSPYRNIDSTDDTYSIGYISGDSRITYNFYGCAKSNDPKVIEVPNYDDAVMAIKNKNYGDETINISNTYLKTTIAEYNGNPVNITTHIFSKNFFNYVPFLPYRKSTSSNGWIDARYTRLYSDANTYWQLKSTKVQSYESDSFLNPLVYDINGNPIINSVPNTVYEIYNDSEPYKKNVICEYDFDRMYIYKTSSGNFFKNITNASYMFANCTNLISVDGCNTANISYFGSKYGNSENRYSDTSVTSINMYKCKDASYMFSGCNHLTFHKNSPAEFFTIGPGSDADFILNKTCNVVGMFSNIYYPTDTYWCGNWSRSTSSGTEYYTYSGSKNPLLFQYIVSNMNGTIERYRSSNIYFNIQYPIIDKMFENMHIDDIGVTFNIQSNCINAVNLFHNSGGSSKTGTKAIYEMNSDGNPNAFMNLPNLINGYSICGNSKLSPVLSAPNVKDLSYGFCGGSYHFKTISANPLPFETHFNGNEYIRGRNAAIMTNETANSVVNISHAFEDVRIYAVQNRYFSTAANYTPLVFPNVEDASYAFSGISYPKQASTSTKSGKGYIDAYLPKCTNFSYTFSHTDGDLDSIGTIISIDLYNSMLNANDISHIFDSSTFYVYNFTITNKCKNTIGWCSNVGSRFSIESIYPNTTNICCDFDASAYINSPPATNILKNSNYFCNFKNSTNSGNHYIILSDNSAERNTILYRVDTNALVNRGWTFINKSDYIKKTGITW